MASKIKNIIIFVSIAAVLILLYVFFIKKDGEEPALISSVQDSVFPGGGTSTGGVNSAITEDFLSLLLSVKGINLDDSIFSDPAFISLRDSSILLIPDGTEGRPNPFAPIGFDAVVVPPANQSTTTPSPAN